MNLELILMSENDIAEFKKNVQCAFQKGFEDVLDGETVGGVIVAIDTVTQHNHLDLLYVKRGVQ